MKPNFLVIGAAKSATTTLCYQLAQHPDVFMSDPKEPGFFSVDETFALGWRWYESLFRNADGARAVGEGSTSYSRSLTWPHAVERIADHLPDARLIYLARHPLHRIESHWKYEVKMGRIRCSFRRALCRHPYLVDASLYWKQIDRYRRCFPDDHILVLFYEDFCEDPAGTIAECWRFLGVDPTYHVGDPQARLKVSAPFDKDGRALRVLRQIPLIDAIAMSTPASLRERLQGWLKVHVGHDCEWPANVRQTISRRIAGDSQSFLEFYGKPRGFWSASAGTDMRMTESSTDSGITTA